MLLWSKLLRDLIFHNGWELEIGLQDGATSSFMFLSSKEIKKWLFSMPIKLPSRLTLTKSLFSEESHPASKVLLTASLLEFNNSMCRQGVLQWEFLTWWIEVESRKKGLSNSTSSQLDGQTRSLWYLEMISVVNVLLYGKENCIFCKIQVVRTCSTSKNDC